MDNCATLRTVAHTKRNQHHKYPTNTQKINPVKTLHRTGKHRPHRGIT